MSGTGVLHGSYYKQGGEPATGKVIVTVNTEKQSVREASGEVVFQGPFTATLYGGEFTLTVPATDDVTLSPNGFTYTVVEALDHVDRDDYRLVTFEVPTSSTVEMAHLAEETEAVTDDGLTYAQHMTLVLWQEFVANGAELVVERKYLAGGAAGLNANITSMIDTNFGTTRGLIRWPGGAGGFEITTDLDMKRASFRGNGPGDGSRDGTTLWFSGGHGLYSSLETDAGFVLEDMRIEGRGADIPTDSGDVLVDWTGQNYPYASNLRVARSGTLVRLSQGATKGCNQGVFNRLNLDKGWINLEGVNPGDLDNPGCNSHSFFGGRFWDGNTLVKIPRRLSNWTFYSNVFESANLRGIDSMGYNIGFDSIRLEQPDSGGNRVESLRIREGAGPHWFGIPPHASSGYDVIDENIPSVLEGRSGARGGDPSGAVMNYIPRNEAVDGQHRRVRTSGIDSGLAYVWQRSQHSLGGGNIAFDCSEEDSEGGFWQHVVNTDVDGPVIFRYFVVAPGVDRTLRFRAKIDEGPLLIYIGDGTSATENSLRSQTVRVPGLPNPSDDGYLDPTREWEYRYTVTPTTELMNVAFRTLGPEPSEFKIGGVMLEQGATVPKSFIPRVVSEYDNASTGSYTTAGRPTAAAAGAGTSIFDTTLGIPIWSNGTVWKNASGTTV